MEDNLRKRIELAAQALKESGAGEVYVFGSAATGTMREDSDIDLAVSGLPPELFIRAMGKLHDFIDRPFDLIDLDDESLFVAYLKRKGKLLRVA